VEKPKGRTKRGEYTARKTVTIFAADDPRGDCDKLEGGFL